MKAPLRVLIMFHNHKYLKCLPPPPPTLSLTHTYADWTLMTNFVANALKYYAFRDKNFAADSSVRVPTARMGDWMCVYI